MPNILAEPPKYLRSHKATGGAVSVDPMGGYRSQGLIENVAVITKGEALGHGMFIDDVMLQQTAEAINETPKGVKSRFTHPSLSGDGLGKTVGRLRNASVLGDKVIADQHFIESGHNSPDGDLAGYLMDLASEDPESYGLSIAFAMDTDASDAFTRLHTGDAGAFESPDELNENNYPHARLSELRAVDAVDEPAANPDGLFRRDQDIAEEADAMAAYALGMKTNLPKHMNLGLDPDRVRGFVSRFLDSHDLEIRDKKMAEEIEAQDIENENIDTIVDQENKEEEVAVQEVAASGREECQRYRIAYGDQGAVWYSEGLSFEAARERYDTERNSRIAELEAKLAAVNPDGEDEPIAFTSEQEDKKNFIHFAY